MPDHRGMKTNLVTLPGMYADWTALGWSMILGKPPTGKGMEPTGNGAHAAPAPKRADPVASVKPAKKKARAKPAAKKSMAKKSAAKRTTQSRALRAAPAKKRSAKSKRR
jgi:hypothetical protein